MQLHLLRLRNRVLSQSIPREMDFDEGHERREGKGTMSVCRVGNILLYPLPFLAFNNQVKESIKTMKRIKNECDIFIKWIVHAFLKPQTFIPDQIKKKEQ